MDFQAIVDKLVSHAAAAGQFERVNAHEPKNSPGNGITAAVWLASVAPAQRQSGLASTTLLLTFTVRCYTSMVQQPADAIDPNLMAAVGSLMSAYTGAFTLGGLIRSVDVLGAQGIPLSAKAGYLEQSGKVYRVMDLTVPLIVNDVYDQAG